MNETPEAVLADAEPILRASLRTAERELKKCLVRCRQLEMLIARTRALLSAGNEPEVPKRGKRYLHEAMLEVLRSLPGGAMRAPLLAAEINRRRLYLNRDGAPVRMRQIHGRVYRYPHLFERALEGIRARS